MEFEHAVHRAVAVDPSVAEVLPQTCTGIYVGVSGDVKIDLVDGGTVILKALAAGVWHAIRATKIYETGTDATDIVISY